MLIVFLVSLAIGIVVAIAWLWRRTLVQTRECSTGPPPRPALQREDGSADSVPSPPTREIPACDERDDSERKGTLGTRKAPSVFRLQRRKKIDSMILRCRRGPTTARSAPTRPLKDIVGWIYGTPTHKSRLGVMMGKTPINRARNLSRRAQRIPGPTRRMEPRIAARMRDRARAGMV